MSSCDFGSWGRGGGVLKLFVSNNCDVLAQQDKFSTDIAITYGCL